MNTVLTLNCIHCKYKYMCTSKATTKSIYTCNLPVLTPLSLKFVM